MNHLLTRGELKQRSVRPLRDAEAGAVAEECHVSTPSRGRKHPSRCFGASQESPVALLKRLTLHMLRFKHLMLKQKESEKEKKT